MSAFILVLPFSILIWIIQVDNISTARVPEVVNINIDVPSKTKHSDDVKSSAEERNRGYRKYCANGGCLNNSGHCSCVGYWAGEHCDISPCTYLDHGDNDCTVRVQTGEAVLRCPPGRVGDNCIDPCSVLNCANGVCRRNASSGQAMCMCRGAFRGKLCEIDPCDNNPCGRYGTCNVNDEGEADCTCEEGWTGEFCQISPCESFSCLNGGTCYTTDEGTPVCDCSLGFFGQNCEIAPCEGFNCNNGTCCAETSTSARCFCDEGYFGTLCDRYICDFVYCNDRGTCLPTTGECQCESPYTGMFCENDPCNRDFCSGNGECFLDEFNQPRCNCDPDFTGQFCEIEILFLDSENSCDPNPCQNGGTCEPDQNGNATCDCVEGWLGTYCEVPICEFFNRSCNNKGTCNNITGNCDCVPPYAGESCQICDASKNVDVVFVVDETGSVRRHNFEKTLLALTETIDILNVGEEARVGLMTFNQSQTLHFHLDMFEDKEELKAAVHNVPYQGGKTSISKALEYTREEMLREERGDRLDASNRVVLITDGQSTIGEKSTRKQRDIDEAQKLKDTGSVLIVVGVGRRVDPPTLRQMASLEEYFIQTSFEELDTELVRIIQAVVNCNK